MDHAVDVTIEADEKTEFSLVLDLALDLRVGRIFLGEGFPRIDERLLQAERNAALDRIDFEYLNLDLLLVATIFPGCTFFLSRTFPTHG